MSKGRLASGHHMQLEVWPPCPPQPCRRRQERSDTDSARDKRKARDVRVQWQAAARQRDANRITGLDLIVQYHGPAASDPLALDGNAIAPVVRRVVAKRIGPDHTAGQVQVDVRPRSKRRKVPMIGVDEREQFDARSGVLDGVNNCLDCRDRLGLHRTFRTASPTRTVPPFKILQFSPDLLMSGSKIAFPVMSSMCRQGIESRVASSSVSPSQN